MSNYIEYHDTVAFHPGYYIKELVDESGLTQEDFAKRLNTTPKNLSILIKGEQSLSTDMALKLSRLLGTSIDYWLNLQKTYDSLTAEFDSSQELLREQEVFKYINYKYFTSNFSLPELPRKITEQIKHLREFLEVSSLCNLKNRNLAVRFRSYTNDLSESNIINANAMVQVAINYALKTDAARYNKGKFLNAIQYALTLTSDHEGFFPLLRKSFLSAGVILIILPHLKNSGINGATKKIGNRVMLMVNDRRHYADTFWFSLFHEVGHILNGDFGITFDTPAREKEDAADQYAQETLIPSAPYRAFVDKQQFNEEAILNFAKYIQRDPGIVLGRLQNDGIVSFTDVLSKKLRHKYNVKISN